MNKKEKVTSKQIFEALNRKYYSTAKYIIPNSCIFKSNWETDCFIQQRDSGYCYEIEIKISRNDFFADFRKGQKHSILKNGRYKSGWVNTENGSMDIVFKEHKNRPNKFFYCVPNGLISINDVPDYCGLMYFNINDGSVEIIKEAPFIHREKINLYNKKQK